MARGTIFGKYNVTSHSVSIKNTTQRMTIDMHHLPGADVLNLFDEHGWQMECSPVFVKRLVDNTPVYCVWFVSNTPDPTQPRPLESA